jgi:hypothetical protein
MRFKTLLALVLASFGLMVLVGCSDENPKSGVKIQQGDYDHSPGGGGGAPKHGGGPAAKNG